MRKMIASKAQRLRLLHNSALAWLQPHLQPEGSVVPHQRLPLAVAEDQSTAHLLLGKVGVDIFVIQICDGEQWLVNLADLELQTDLSAPCQRRRPFPFALRRNAFSRRCRELRSAHRCWRRFDRDCWRHTCRRRTRTATTVDHHPNPGPAACMSLGPVVAGDVEMAELSAIRSHRRPLSDSCDRLIHRPRCWLRRTHLQRIQRLRHLCRLQLLLLPPRRLGFLSPVVGPGSVVGLKGVDTFALAFSFSSFSFSSFSSSALGSFVLGSLTVAPGPSRRRIRGRVRRRRRWRAPALFLQSAALWLAFCLITAVSNSMVGAVAVRALIPIRLPELL